MLSIACHLVVAHPPPPPPMPPAVAHVLAGYRYGESKRGTRYVYGAGHGSDDDDGLDCSAMAGHTTSVAGDTVPIPTTQSAAGYARPARGGDLVTWGVNLSRTHMVVKVIVPVLRWVRLHDGRWRLRVRHWSTRIYEAPHTGALIRLTHDRGFSWMTPRGLWDLGVHVRRELQRVYGHPRHHPSRHHRGRRHRLHHVTVRLDVGFVAGQLPPLFR